MSKLTNDDLKSKINTLIDVPFCYVDLKNAGADYIEAIGTNREKDVAKAFYKELEEDVLPIDTYVEFTASPKAAEMFGEENAAKMHISAIESREKGEKYCTCAACQAGKALLLIKDDVLRI